MSDTERKDPDPAGETADESGGTVDEGKATPAPAGGEKRPPSGN